jgi:hypothetical protein
MHPAMKPGARPQAIQCPFAPGCFPLFCCGMNVEALRELHNTRPFVPHTLSLADGRKLFVRHNDHLTIAPSGRLAIMTHDHGRFTMIDLNLVVTADEGDLTSSPTPSS